MEASTTTRKVIEFLKAHVGEQLTSDTIAKAIEETKQKVNGSLLALSKKELFTREEVETEVDGTKFKYKVVIPQEKIISYDPETDLGKNAGKAKTISPNTRKVADYLKTKIGTEEKFTSKDLAQALDIEKKSVEGVLTGLSKKGFIEREKVPYILPDGKTGTISYIKVFETLRDF